MTKVLIVSVGKLSGGVESYTLILGKLLSENDIEVHYAVRAEAWLDQQLPSINKITVNLGKNMVNDMKRLRDYVDANGINIVHCNSNNGLFVSQMIKETSKCKKIGVIHGDVIVDQRHNGLIKSYIYEKIETWLIKKKCTKCIAVSESMKNILVARGVRESKIEVVYNGIIPKEYDTLPDYYSGILKVCTVGNLLPVKNQIILLKALYLLREKYPDIKVICDIYGEGTERKNLESYIAEKGLTNVMLKGFDNDVRNKMNDYQIYIHTSNYESFGISVVEAMNAGCCVIATDVGGIKEIVKEKCGFTVNKENFEAIVEIIVECFNNREKMKNVALRGRNRFKEEFTCNHMVNNILNIYREMK